MWQLLQIVRKALAAVCRRSSTGRKGQSQSGSSGPAPVPEQAAPAGPVEKLGSSRRATCRHLSQRSPRKLTAEVPRGPEATGGCHCELRASRRLWFQIWRPASRTRKFRRVPPGGRWCACDSTRRCSSFPTTKSTTCLPNAPLFEQRAYVRKMSTSPGEVPVRTVLDSRWGSGCVGSAPLISTGFSRGCWGTDTWHLRNEDKRNGPRADP